MMNQQNPHSQPLVNFKQGMFIFLASFHSAEGLKLLQGTTCIMLNQSQEIQSGVKMPLLRPSKCSYRCLRVSVLWYFVSLRSEHFLGK